MLKRRGGARVFREGRRMKVLILGSGAREHALALAAAKSPRLERLYVAPGNPGCAEAATLVRLDLSDSPAIVSFCKANAIDLVIVGPEAPLVAGIADNLAAAGVACFGPSRAAAQLEGSKGFTKDFCREFGVPTGAYRQIRRARRRARLCSRARGADRRKGGRTGGRQGRRRGYVARRGRGGGEFHVRRRLRRGRFGGRR